ncbi:hypothetical protein [Micromonospora orduensis]|uniref:hypothetical protein n=1 Tax=Micromonospora orduensis TaxID=1420891 RepID=UPI003F541C26
MAGSTTFGLSERGLSPVPGLSVGAADAAGRSRENGRFRSTPPDATGGCGTGEPGPAADVPAPGAVLADSGSLATGVPATGAAALPGWSLPAVPAVPAAAPFAGTFDAGGPVGAVGSAGGGQLACPGAQPEAAALFPHPPGAGTAPVSDG